MTRDSAGMTTSVALFSARALVDELARGAVAHVCIAPGSRSTALALAVAERKDLVSHVVTDERSLAFFALGIARATASPVAIICTSGTAVANLLPAVVESALGGGALVLLTADRPPELRDCASPQTIDQVGIFGSHVSWSADVPILETTETSARVLRSLAARAVATATAGRGAPVHLNVPLREPFTDDSFPLRTAFDIAARADGRPYTQIVRASSLSRPQCEAIAERLRDAQRGVIVCAGPGQPAAAVAELARVLCWPVLADPLAGMRFGSHDRSQVVDACEPLLRDDGLRARLRPDCILRFGLTPAPRSIQRWMEEAWPGEHIVVADAGKRDWPDPVRAASTVVRTDAAGFCREITAALRAAPSAIRANHAWLQQWLSMSAAARAALDRGLAAESRLFDGIVLRSVVAALPDGATLVVGNSMPVRDADTFLASDDRALRVLANRGASGIDGVLSTALGVAAASDGPTALVVGDLSFLHDSAALVLAARERISLLVVVVNNDGGGIFSYLPLHETLVARAGDAPGRDGASDVFERFFTTPHAADLEKLAAVTGGFFARVVARATLEDSIRAGLEASARGPAVVEVVCDREAARLAHLAVVETAQRAGAQYAAACEAPAKAAGRSA